MILVMARDINNGVGMMDGSLPWGLSMKKDLANFKKITLGGVVIMGSKTYDSMGCKPLPKRNNIVLTRSIEDKYRKVCCNSVSYLMDNYPDAFVIGGAKTAEVFLDSITEAYITTIGGAYESEIFLSSKLVDKLESGRVISEEVWFENGCECRLTHYIL